jgi:hypothetical protein
VVQLATELRDRTDWSPLELIVVDWSVGEDPLSTRTRILESGVFDKVLLRDQRYCVYNNTNLARENSSGCYLVGFEDDVRLRRDAPKSWLSFLVQEMQENCLDDVSLWSESCSSPPSLAYISSVMSVSPFPRYDCYPSEFSTISESMRRGASFFAERYRRSGRRLRGIPLVETSLSVPSRNLAKLSDLAGYSWKKLDELVEKGVALERMNNVDFVSADQYARMGGWEGMNWTILSESRDGEKVRQRLRRWRLLVPVYRVTLRVKSRLSRGISKIRAVNRDAK